MDLQIRLALGAATPSRPFAYLGTHKEAQNIGLRSGPINDPQ